MKNNYTCIKPQGMSVVDYCIIPHEYLNKYAEFTVYTVSDLITDINAQSEFAAVSIPEHSVLSWEVDVGSYAQTCGYNGITTTYTVYKKQILDNFLEDQIPEIEACLNRFEQHINYQNDMDRMYSDK